MNARDVPSIPACADAPITIRKAAPRDAGPLMGMHRAALRELSRDYYTPLQVDSFLRHVSTLDDVLVRDGTYFVAEVEGRLVGSGGWSFRPPGYGASIDLGDYAATGKDIATVRGTYTHPDWARRGIGRRILAAAEAEAQAAGYIDIELHALLPGVPLYSACAYETVAHCWGRLPDGVPLPVVHMRKRLAPICGSSVSWWASTQQAVPAPMMP